MFFQPASITSPSTAILDRGDVLLSAGNTRVAELVKRITRSTWSHVSCTSVRLKRGRIRGALSRPTLPRASDRYGSPSWKLHVRVLRPIGLNDMDRRRLADWVVGRIGGEYDLAHAWVLGRNLLRQRLPTRLRSLPYTIAKNATRFICCSLLAHAFALVGYPILPAEIRVGPTGAADHGNLTPADFEGAPVFRVVWPDWLNFCEDGSIALGCHRHCPLTCVAERGLRWIAQR